MASSSTPTPTAAPVDHVLLHGEYLDTSSLVDLDLLHALAPAETPPPVFTVWETPSAMAPDLGDVDLLPPWPWP
ncbi:MAG: hypothetical protein FJW64_12570 [Actinobacteria bacterium]|nr:hypothetical protein [Actinomycetota bacterium]